MKVKIDDYGLVPFRATEIKKVGTEAMYKGDVYAPCPWHHIHYGEVWMPHEDWFMSEEICTQEDECTCDKVCGLYRRADLELDKAFEKQVEDMLLKEHCSIEPRQSITNEELNNSVTAKGIISGTFVGAGYRYGMGSDSGNKDLIKKRLQSAEDSHEELEFLKEQRGEVKNILAGYGHEDPHYYGVYLNAYEKLSVLIDKLNTDG
jgi:hypothetical protein